MARAEGVTPRQLVVDANPLMAALLGGRAAEILALPDIEFVTTERTIWEVRKYFPHLSHKIGVPEAEILSALEASPVRTIAAERYDHARSAADRAIGSRHPKDAEILALALALEIPLWSNDREFEGVPGLVRFTTEDLIALLPAAP